jgi:hypothetical protein
MENNYRYAVLQLTENQANASIMFCSYNEVLSMGTTISYRDYSFAASGKIMAQNAGDALDGLFERYNTGYPGNQGRSMSVSDVVLLWIEASDLSEVSAYYCDPVGWRKLSDFCEGIPPEKLNRFKSI